MIHLRCLSMLLIATVISAGTCFADDLELSNCSITVIDEVNIPAQKEGVLWELPVREGDRVAKGDLLANVDDREAQAQLRIAEYGLNAAQKRAEDMIEEKYARKAAEVAKVDWEQDLEANLRHPNAVPEIEIRQKKLAWERSLLQIEKAQKDRELAGLDADTKVAERDAAIVNLEKRTIVSPFDGEVVRLLRKESEWVSPGEPILKLARFDKLYVESLVSARDFDRGELRDRSVTVVATKARGKEVEVQGTIVHIAQQIQSDGQYIVRAEIENTMQDDNWAIQPGMQARMTIHMK